MKLAQFSNRWRSSNLRFCLALLVFIFQGVPIGATEKSPNDDTCELHIFPVHSVLVNDVTQNNFGGLVSDLVNSVFSVKSPDEIAAFLRAAIPPADELKVLNSINYADTWKGGGAQVVVHDAPYTGDALGVKVYKTSPPVVENSTSCYRELVLMGLYYEKGAMHKSIKTTYYYRTFDNGKMSTKPKIGVEGTSIKQFPPDNIEEAEVARITVRNAYYANLLRILNKK